MKNFALIGILVGFSAFLLGSWRIFNPLFSAATTELGTLELKLEVDPIAIESLVKQNEKIIIKIRLFGSPTESLNNSLMGYLWVDGKSGHVNLANYESEVTPQTNKVFLKSLKLPSEKLSRVKNQDVFLHVQATSARLSNPKNLLDCSFLDGSYSILSKQNNTIRCNVSKLFP